MDITSKDVVPILRARNVLQYVIVIFCKMMKYAILKKNDEMYIIKSVKYNRILKALKFNAFVIVFKDLTKCAVWHNIDLE